MGRCWRCDTELRLIGRQWLCDNCDEPMGYICWNCKYDFEVRDSETKKKIPECNSCGCYYCPECKSCASDCPKLEWGNLILNILAGQTTLDNSLIINNHRIKIKRIVELIETLKIEKKEQRVCPYFVYSSYARGRRGEQGKIKQLLAKMKGIGVKSDSDTEGFKRQFEKILGLDENTSFTVNELREDGRYGNEERDACSLGICMGELKGQLTITKKGKKAIVYTKVKNTGKCQYLREDNFVTKRCPKCHKDYNNSQLEYYQPNIYFCPTCIYKKGKKKNLKVLLKISETNTFTCNCPWNKFTTVHEGNNNEGESDNGEKE